MFENNYKLSTCKAFINALHCIVNYLNKEYPFDVLYDEIVESDVQYELIGLHNINIGNSFNKKWEKLCVLIDNYNNCVLMSKLMDEDESLLAEDDFRFELSYWLVNFFETCDGE